MARGMGLLGQKVGMTQVFDKDGRAVGATVILAGPCTVLKVKSTESDGYAAVQVAFREEPKPERLGKPFSGQFVKLGVPVHRWVAEFLPPRTGEFKGTEGLAAGAKVTVELFKKGDRVDVQGTSKGHGFQGVVKRHGFRGGPDSHGSMSHRAPGSIGASTDPGHTLRGTRMAGRHGNASAVSQNLEVIDLDAERHLLVLKGAVPGATGSLVRVTPTTKRKAPSARRLTVEVRETEGAKTAAKKAPPKK